MAKGTFNKVVRNGLFAACASMPYTGIMAQDTNIPGAEISPLFGIIAQLAGESSQLQQYKGHHESPEQLNSDSLALTVSGAPDTSGMAGACNCDFASFHSTCSPFGVQLSWELKSESGVERYQVQKWNGTAYEVIGLVTASSASNGMYIFLDPEVPAGTNTYRIAAEFSKNKKRVFTQPSIATLAGKSKNLPMFFQVKPVAGSDEFTVFSALHSSATAVVYVADADGLVVQWCPTVFNESGLASIQTSQLGSGIYYIGIADTGKRLLSEVVIMH